MKTKYTRDYIDTLEDAAADLHAIKNLEEQLIDKYGYSELENQFREKSIKVAKLNIEDIEDEASDDPIQWIKRIKEYNVEGVLSYAKEAIPYKPINIPNEGLMDAITLCSISLKQRRDELAQLMEKYDKPASTNYMKVFDNTLPTLVDSYECNGKILNPHELHQTMIDENAIPFDVEFGYFIFCVLHAEYGRLIESSQSRDKVRVFASTIADTYFDREYKQAAAKSMGCSVSDLTKHKGRPSIKEFVIKLNKLM